MRIWVERCGLAMAAGIAALAIAVPTAAQTQKLRVAADVGYAPHVMVKPTGGVEGYNVDLAEAIAKELGKELEVVDQQWSGIFAGLNAEKYDFIIAPTTITAERAESMLFTEGYLGNDYQFSIKKGAPQITELEDLKGKTIAVNKGNLYDKWATERADKYGWTIMRYDKNADAIQAVLAGRAAANLAADTVAGWVGKQNPMIQPSKLIIESGQVYGLAFRLDDVERRNRIELILECLKKDGTIAAIHEKWTGQKPRAGGPVFEPQPGFGPPGFNGHDPKPHDANCN